MKKCMGCMEEFDENQTLCPHCGYEEGTMPAEVYHMEPGSILAKRYIVGKTLGYGGFGVTYIGYDAELERKVAIKEYLPGEFSTRVPGQTQVTIYDGERKEQFQSGIEKFMDEAKRLAKFQDTEGVVHIYDSFLYNDTAYIIMEYIDGETLKSKLERDGKMSIEETLNVILPVVSALKEVHEIGIIHRDISPDNIMISKDGKVSLIDFGASRFATSTHSKSLSVLIKPGYAPVEQYQSRGDQGPWTDVYALASTMYYILTGIVPEDAMERMGKDELKSLSKLGIKVDKNIETAIMNAMNLKIEERTPSMEAFEEELTSRKTVVKLAVAKEKQDVGKWPMWAKTFVGLAAALITTFFVLMLTGVISFREGDLSPVIVTAGNTMVPNVVNTTVEVAEAKSSNKKLKIQIVGKEYSDEIEEGIILSQNITGGDVVEEDTVLEVVISAGKESVFMTSLVGKTKEEAIVWLDTNGIKYTIEEIESMSTPGTIATQSVAADEKIAKGDTVVLQVSTGISGIDNKTEVSMPDLSKLTYAQAQKKMEELGLYLSIETSVYDMKVAKDKVISQSVPSGTVLHQGDSVTVVVSLGKEQVRVPYVQYETEANAKQMISNAGLMVSVKYEYSATVKQGVVITQGIEKDTLVDIGTTIEIVVSSGAEPVKNTAWSGWVDSLPAGVDSSKYEIETRDVWYIQNKTTLPATTDSTLASQGWTLEQEIDEYSEYGSWSDITENPPTESDIVDVSDPITQYNYQYYNKENGEGTSIPSGWTQERCEVRWNGSSYESADGTNTELRKAVYAYTKPAVEKYVYWHYSNGAIASAENTMSNSHYTMVYLDSPLQDRGGSQYKGYRIYGYHNDPCCDKNIWYNNVDAGQKRTFEPAVNMYTVTDGYYYYYYSRYIPSSQSGFGDKKTESVTCKQIGTRTVYKYRTRTHTKKYIYSKWSEWQRSETEVLNNSTTKVEKRKEYRYKEK